MEVFIILAISGLVLMAIIKSHERPPINYGPSAKDKWDLAIKYPGNERN